jgi:glycosyltransferase involved in cell wall biosynthesis
MERSRPEIAHFHNTFPLISPAAYHAATAAGVPVVQTLHNYRLLCANGLLFRDGHVCEDCLGKTIPWPGQLHACYRHSQAATAAVTTMLSVHRLLGTWTKSVTGYVALSEFSRRKFVEAGLPEQKIAVKPNFIGSDPGAGAGEGGYALFVGRLSEEKGIRTMLAAWEEHGTTVPLKIVGEGPLGERVSETAQRAGTVEWLGRRSKEEVQSLMRQASFLVFPSEWYENFPMVIVEAFATGLPVLASELGSAGELVVGGRTGLHFRPGDARDLVAKAESLHSRPGQLAPMRAAARQEYLAKYTAERNYEILAAIYQKAMKGR